ncbi:MAG: cytochrome c family protein [Pseudomonadota bacterium]
MNRFRCMIGLSALLAATSIHAQSAPDPVAGQKQFGQCRACHATTAQAPAGVGPNLLGVFGSIAASRPGKYAYSAALKGSKIKWDEATLDKWLTDPAATVKGTKMEFIGIPRKPVRQNIIAYLKTVK